ncbi:MAG: hypothetical protein A3E01_18800 [Gammaproteobacteria bacterium RIFCSPHIGHO2_12_FULL_63_22]|nr:MAG: hypothetical protein A3E01_18800 [Gammaproteobacteria bacterium RIFCSPHIGHO2_12_FULL_63_22]
MTFTVRPAHIADAAMLYELHVATMRQAIEATWGWDDTWQQQDFRARFLPEGTQIILVAGEVVGVLETEVRPEAFFVVNIKIKPDRQSTGIGTSVLRWVMATAASQHIPVRLQVLLANVRARQFYERLGFQATEQTATYLHLQYHTPASR